MIVGTAGHIDHGKTSLVRALTGIETDRLEQEKVRGISIELGYAYVPVEGAAADAEAVLGFVDVPGHERLVHTMVAGAGGIDFALLVVAADDGVMPQTREHVAILDLLGMTHGAVAISKIDRVDAARVRAVEAQVATLLATTRLRDAPVFALDASRPGDAGVATLRAYLHAVAAQAAQRRADGLFRLAVDRVFSLAGHGTIATGSVHAGRVRVGDTLAILPRGTKARVRAIHAHNRQSPLGMAGQRCAINLAGIARDALARGDWLADPRLARPSPRIDVRVRLLPDSDVSLRARTPVHLHLGTAHMVAHAIALDADVVSAGDTARVQLVFDQPLCAVSGDRFIMRDARAARTIGGGVVLDPLAPERRRRSAARLAWLDAIERMLAGAGIGPLLEQAPRGIALDDLACLCGRAADEIDMPPTVHRVETPAAAYVFHGMHWQALRERIRAALAAFHEAQPDEAGIDPARLRRSVEPTLDAALWRSLLDAFLADGTIARSGPWLHLAAHRVEPGDAERALLARVLPVLAEAGFDPPWVRDMAAALGEDEAQLRSALRRSAARGEVLQVVRDLFYARERIDELARILRELAARHGAVEAARWRDAIGVGRKRAIQLLEFFDRVGYTRRVRDAHRLRRDSAWPTDA